MIRPDLGSIIHVLAHGKPDDARLDEVTLEQLWAEAETFGGVYIHSSSGEPLPNRYYCEINFETVPGVSLSAKSAFRLPLKQALCEAIESARKISTQFKDGAA